MNDDYLQDLMVRMAHESTALEGNTLTGEEVSSILIHDYIPRPVTMQEVRDIVSYKKLLLYLLKHRDEEITVASIQDINRILADNHTASSQSIKAMKKWAEDLSWRLEYSTTPEEKLQSIMKQHLQFSKMDPFLEDTGKVGRALILWSCLKEKIAPIIITLEQKALYGHAIAQHDEQELENLAAESQMQEKKRLAELDDEYKIDKNLLKTLSDELEEAHGTFYQDEQLESEYSQNRTYLNSVITKRDQEQIKWRVRDYKEHCKSKSRTATQERELEDPGRERF